ncbi:unnamed protein product [Linum tenue]|uniref:NAD-dependent epimerase/dehydratase domain-containing protein n=1 Tax=Linum tenue TaxID=586396 RepID=A0AAV0ND01_9ROSI|nr:unnamed protein product [Linum tenue]
MIMGSGDGTVVAVTGASGFIASWLVKLLLQHGYTVKASVRDPTDRKKTAHLLELPGAKERLKLFKADLLDVGSFDSVVQGCAGVFHTASPVSFSAADPQAEIIDPAVKGTLNVLKSCVKSATVKRVIVTSSAAALFFTGKPMNQDSVVDETWFSDPMICQERKLWYQLGKTLAEIAGREFANENGIELVTIHPGLVSGPFLHHTLCFSVEVILNLVNGNKTYPKMHYWSVDVRDVAEAHLRAFETPSAHDRYCLVGSGVSLSEVLGILHKLYPALPLADKCDEMDILKLPEFEISKEKAEESLGMKFIPLEDPREKEAKRPHEYKSGGDKKKTAHLVGLDGAKERLQLFKAELLDEGSFDSAIEGCSGVFHTASPVSFSAVDPQTEIIDPAVKGTLNVLKSCAKSPFVKRVIVTSSIASIFYTGKPVTKDSVADETWFSDPEHCKELKFWYQLSKTLAESAAWDFAKENGIDMVTIHPGVVIGPFLQPTPCFSVEIILNLVNGNKSSTMSHFWWVDVRDVAEAHIKAFETPSASGRYCLVGSSVPLSEVLGILHKLYPTLPLADECEELDILKLPGFGASKKKAEEGLGIKFIPLEESLKDTIECLKEKGFLHF